MDRFEVPKKVEICCLYKDSISRVWEFIKDLKYHSSINCDIISDVQFKTGDNSFTIGNEITWKWNGVTNVYFKCIDIQSSECYKKISWEVTFDTLNIKCLQSFSLFKTTCDNMTVFLWEIEMYNEKSITLSQKFFEEFRSIMSEVVKRYDTLLQTSIEHIQQFEAVTINCDIRTTWNLITNWKKFREVAPAIGEAVEYVGEPTKVNSEINIILKKKKKISIMLLVVKSECDEDMENCEYWLESPKIKSQMFPFQEIRLTVRKTSENGCYLSFFHIFKEKIIYETLKSLSEEKKKILKSVKEYLENTL